MNTPPPATPPNWGADPILQEALVPAHGLRGGKCLLWFLILAALLVSAGWWLLRERWSRAEDVTLADGRIIHVKESSSQWRYFGGHGFGFGGGGYGHELEFTYDGRKYSWDGNSIPIVLQLDGSHPVLITFDRETNFAKIAFRYYRHDDGWEEMPLTSFPPRLAIQNMWFGQDDQFRRADLLDGQHTKLLRRADPADAWFRRSLLARLRYCIIHGTQYWDIQDREIEEQFLEQFARDHLRQ